MNRTLIISVFALVVSGMFLTGFQCASSEMTTAKMAIQSKDYQKAQTQLEMEVQKNPKNEEAWYTLGQVRYELKEYRTMKNAFEQALAISNTHEKEINNTLLYVWGTTFNQGIEKLNQGTIEGYNGAIEDFSLTTFIMPDSLINYQNLGLAYYLKSEKEKSDGKIAESEMTVQKAIEPLNTAFEKGGDAYPAKLLGNIYLNKANELKNKFTTANQEIFSTKKMLSSIQKGIKSVDVKYTLGTPTKTTKAKKGKTEEWSYSKYNLMVSVDGDVVSDVKYATPYNPPIDSTDFKRALKEYNNAIEIYKRAVAKFPEDAEISENLMNAYIGAEKTAEARILLEERVQKYPNSKFDRYNLGVFLLKDEKYEKAVEQFKATVELDEKDGEKSEIAKSALYNLAASYVNWGVAEQDRLKKEKKDKDDSYKEKYQKALPYLEQILQTKQNDIQLWELLGQVYANLNMADKAKNAFDKADAIRQGKN